MLKNRLPFCPKTIEFNCWSFVQRCLTLNEMPSWPSTFLKLKTKWLLSVKSGLSGLLGLCVQKKKFLEKSLTKRFFICFRFNTCSAMSVFTGPSDHILRWKRAKEYIIDASFFLEGGDVCAWTLLAEARVRDITRLSYNTYLTWFMFLLDANAREVSDKEFVLADILCKHSLDF